MRAQLPHRWQAKTLGTKKSISPSSVKRSQYRIHLVKVAKKYGQINKIIPMQDILEGRLIEKLQQWIDNTLDTELYNHWLNKIIAPLPKVD